MLKMFMRAAGFGFMGIGTVGMIIAIITDEVPVILAGGAIILLGMYLWWKYGD